MICIDKNFLKTFWICAADKKQFPAEFKSVKLPESGLKDYRIFMIKIPAEPGFNVSHYLNIRNLANPYILKILIQIVLK